MPGRHVYPFRLLRDCVVSRDGTARPDHLEFQFWFGIEPEFLIARFRVVLRCSLTGCCAVFAQAYPSPETGLAPQPCMCTTADKLQAHKPLNS